MQLLKEKKLKYFLYCFIFATMTDFLKLLDIIPQAELVRRTGISKATLWRYKNGTTYPTLVEIEKIATAVGKKICFVEN